ncbi:MAG: hypothetical protein KME32_01425 [Mojavia pulchra JT2-VF2]|jgi:hypothetical protein|uniref:Uncharacterized protein n=1 Tax=Mojavia pulchra JT2-VF2 TaxID=287848 RepID=A0A951PTR5_9NOST|nr:hypothetical protein [Mojavia pulchra JT2-VF2]
MKRIKRCYISSQNLEAVKLTLTSALMMLLAIVTVVGAEYELQRFVSVRSILETRWRRPNSCIPHRKMCIAELLWKTTWD